MISMVAAACVILLGFRKLMFVCLDPRLDWDVSPLALLFLTVITAARFRAELHRRLT